MIVEFIEYDEEKRNAKAENNQGWTKKTPKDWPDCITHL